MQHINILTRRSFMDRSWKVGLGVALSTLVDIPLVVKRALAEGNIGQPDPGTGKVKKVLFIFLRGANDALNSVVPVQDPAYYNMGTVASPILTRSNIGIPKDPTTGFDYSTPGPCFDPTQYSDVGGTPRGAADPTFSYGNAIKLGNGFAALHPSLKFLAPVFTAGHLALVHRTGYPRQSRSHFDSQNYWENGNPNNNLVKDGIFYRAMVESGLANTAPLTGISVQSSLPLMLRGSAAAMTNLSDPTRYDLLGIPGNTGDAKAAAAISTANRYAFPDKQNRELLSLQYQNLNNTLSIFATLNFSEAGNTFRDDSTTDSDSAWYSANGSQGYYLFPTTNDKNGGWRRTPGGATDANKYVVDTGSYSFFNSLKSAALVLNNTDAIVAGTEVGGFDTHSVQGGVTGAHANLQRRIGWAIYALRKYFQRYSNKADWDNMIVVTLSEFGRTTVENSDRGTDHAEAGVMFVAGGKVKGYNGTGPSGVYGCNLTDPVPWIPGPPNHGTLDGSMFGVSDRYLKRAIDYRSVLGEIIRDHLGATQSQLNRIIPAYAVTGERLQSGGTSTDGAPIMGELGLV